MTFHLFTNNLEIKLPQKMKGYGDLLMLYKLATKTRQIT